MNWRQKANRHIEPIVSRMAADAIDQEPQKRTLLQRVSKALKDSYPFDSRSGWAYKAWLSERRRLLHAYGICALSEDHPDHPSRRGRKPEADHPGQLTLFDQLRRSS